MSTEKVWWNKSFIHWVIYLHWWFRTWSYCWKRWLPWHGIFNDIRRNDRCGGGDGPVVVKSLATDIIFEGSSYYKVKGAATSVPGGLQGRTVQLVYPLQQCHVWAGSRRPDRWCKSRKADSRKSRSDSGNGSLQYAVSVSGKVAGSGGAYESLPYRSGLITLENWRYLSLKIPDMEIIGRFLTAWCISDGT